MDRKWFGAALAALVLTVAVGTARADDISDLKAQIDELRMELDRTRDELQEVQAARTLSDRAVENAVDDYLTARAEGEDSTIAGAIKGKFKLGHTDGDYDLEIGGRIHMDVNIGEPDSNFNNRFRLRRVRLAFKGKLADFAKFKIQPDFAGVGSFSLKDAYLDVAVADLIGSDEDILGGLTLRGGQFLQPFGWAELTSSNQFDTVERPIINSLAAGRDVGFMLHGGTDGFRYYIACANGSNGSSNDNDDFTYTARVEFDLYESDDTGFQLGIDGYSNPHVTTTSTGFKDTTSGTLNQTYPVDGSDMRFGIDGQFNTGCLGVKFEWLYASQETARSFKASTPSADSNIITTGGWIQLLYMFTGENWTDKPKSGLEGVLGFEWGSSDAGVSGPLQEASWWSCTLGANYYFNKNFRVMLHWQATDLTDDGIKATPIKDGNRNRADGLNHTFFLRFALTF